MSILHLAEPGSITEKFFQFIEENVDCSDHDLLSFSKANFNLIPNKLRVVEKLNKIKSIIDFYIYSNKAEKIIIHGLFGWHLPLLLALNPWLLRRCYWVIWGGDLYYYNLRIKSYKSDLFELLRKFVIKQFGHLVTYIEGDVSLARKWYDANGKYHFCIMYPSNIYHPLEVPVKTTHETVFLVGNSADPSNNHHEVFAKLKKLNLEKIKIFCPLSYGNMSYADKVAQAGHDLFGDRFVALRDFMPFEQYVKLLGEVDIAVFAHKRQQAMGNTITLLGLGKKVYVRNDITPWSFFSEIGIELFNFDQLDIMPISAEVSEKNKIIISNFFSSKNLKTQLEALFSGN